MTLRAVREPLEGDLSPAQAVLALRGDRLPFALSGEWAGARAVLGSEPLRQADGDADPFALLDELPRPVADASEAGGPRVGGGWFGWLGYELARRVERLPPPPPPHAAIAQWWLGYYDHVVVLDEQGWSFEALWTPGRAEELDRRLELWRSRIAAPAAGRRAVALEPFRPVGPGGDGHRLAVGECVERITHGEMFQANICMRLEAGWSGEAVDLFARGVEEAEPRFGALFADSVVSLSPERFLRRSGRVVETDPIKGTSGEPAALESSAKDAAEHVMIVDLMRNDLGRVCRYASIEARPPRIERHANVFHMVSTVAGELRDDATDADLLRATFAPGSVTGAPKVQAMKTISRLEATARGLYTGAIGYASPIAGLELSVAIRTFELTSDRIWIGVGGGIVADSDPDAELAEALAKGRGPIAAIGGTLDGEAPPAPAGGRDDPAGRARRRAATRALPRALDLGDRPDPRLGVFETALAIDGAVQHAAEHIARLRASVGELYGVDLPDGALALLEGAAVTFPQGRSRVRLDAVPAGASVALSVRAAQVVPAPAPSALFPLLLPGGLGAHKWIDRRLVEAASEHAGPHATPLLVDGDGAVLETDRANIWIAEGDRRITPPADGRILPGVTRARLLLEPGAVAEPITLERLERADAVLISSSIAELRELRFAGGRGTPELAAAQSPSSSR